MPKVPEMIIPSSVSTIVFVLIVAFIAIAFVVGVWRGDEGGQTTATRKRWAVIALTGMLALLVFGTVVPLSQVLERDMMPPPVMIFVASCFLVAIATAFSPLGTRLSSLPLAALVGFHAFRLPLEMVLHRWYETGTIPIQMTWSGHNFDVATGIFAIVICVWAMIGEVPRKAIWLFNIVGSLLLIAVIAIALLSAPIPIRQYMNDPPLLLAYVFPYSWIVSVVVSSALMWHIVLFRRLLAASMSTKRHVLSDSKLTER